jgi:ubiquinone/menaquinone biosynthesis C-methylase UbiE
MTTTTEYSLGHTDHEYTRLREQARVWESATGRLLDRVELAPGARCLDAGCGPGETMRLMAQRVGPEGRVVGVDVDAGLGERTMAMLTAAGHGQCAFAPVDVTAAADVPEAPFDLVFARLLLFHLPERVEVLRRLWSWVAPGGHLVIQDYDARYAGVLPELESMDELRRVILTAFAAAGCDVAVGHRLPALFEQAGIGAPDGTDVAGKLEPLATGSRMFLGVYRSLLPVALARGITDEARSERWVAALEHDARGRDDCTALWPLLIGAHKRKPR